MADNFRERYVVENGIPTIRPLHPETRKPMSTVKEQEEAWANYQAALATRGPIEWGEIELPEVVNVEEIEIDLNDFGSY